MSEASDPYEVLGVSRDATLEEIRAAYRRSALACHPDNYRGDGAEAERRFLELTEAYRRVSRRFGRDAWRGGGYNDGKTATPQDFAWANFGWHFDMRTVEGREGDAELRHHRGARRLCFPTRDEPALFVCFWIMAIVLAVAVVYSVAASGALGHFQEQLGAWDVLALVAISLAIYAAGLAAIIGALVLTRRVVWLVHRLTFRGRRALPSAKNNKLPRT